MRKAIVLLVVLAGAGAGFMFFNRAGGQAPEENAAGQPGPGGRAGGPGAGGQGRGGGRGGAGGAFARPPMAVDVSNVSRESISEFLLVVGTLIGEATVEVASKVTGRLQSITVRLGDPVKRGQLIATVEDSELLEQVKQAEASNEVSSATVRQREADLKFTETSLERSRNLFGRQLVPRQTLEDSEARHQAATAQVDLAKAQYQQARARLDELRITLSNTRILSPTDGFVGKRYLDPGAFANQNSTVVSVVDIRSVRLVVNLVEKDLRQVKVGAPAVAEVDAFPGESFTGRVARIAPVLDPATRTAGMEIELPNPLFRLKPGMYARVRLTIGQRDNALVVPRNAIVDEAGAQGVFLVDEASRTARFQKVEVGLSDDRRIEVLSGLSQGQTVITTGATSLNDGDALVLPGSDGGGRGGFGRGAGRGAGRGGPAGAQVSPTDGPRGQAAPTSQSGRDAGDAGGAGGNVQPPAGGRGRGRGDPGDGPGGGSRASQQQAAPGPR